MQDIRRSILERIAWARRRERVLRGVVVDLSLEHVDLSWLPLPVIYSPGVASKSHPAAWTLASKPKEAA